MEQILSFFDKFTKTEKAFIVPEKMNELRYMCREEVYYDANMPRILVIGRFKAGKSMLINALIGKKVAAVDALEKTSWIARYWPGDEFCYLQKKDGTVQEISVNEFIENTEDDKYSVRFLSEISRIDVGYQAGEKLYTLIDSPGFGSVNAENEKRALDSLKDADLVIYAVDVNKMGNLRERSIISEIKKSGVPMICVGTQFDGDIARRKTRDDVRKMIADYTEFSCSEIYPVSAKNYLNSEPRTEEGMEELLEFCRKVAVQNKLYRENAASARKYRTNHTLILHLQELQAELYRITGARKRFELEYDYIRSRIRSEMALFIREYVSRTLYVEYKDQLIRMIYLINQQNLGERGLDILQNIVPAGYMNRYWEELREQVLQKMHELWKEKYAVPSTGMAELRELFKESTVLRNMDVAQLGNFLQLGYNKELSEKGMKLSFGVAGLASVYEAVLGVNAAQVALSGALVSTGLPIMLIGCGLTTYWLKKRRDTEKDNNVDVKNALERNIEHFAECVIDLCMKKVEQIDLRLKEIYMSHYEKELQKYLPEKYTVESLLYNCQQYIGELARELENLVYYDEEGNAALNRIYELSGKIETLNLDLDKLSMENATYRKDLERAEEERKRAQKEREQAEQKYANAQEVTMQLKDTLQKAKRDVRYYQNLATTNEQAAQKARSAAETLTGRLEDAKKREENLKFQAEQARRDGVLSQSKLMELDAALREVSEEKDKISQDLSIAKARVLSMETEAGRAVEREKQACQQMQQAEEAWKNKDSELKIAEEQLEATKDKVIGLTKKKKELEKKLKERRAHEKELEEKLEGLHQEWNTNTYQPQDEYLSRRKKINEDLDKIIHDGRNKYVLNEEMDPDLEQFENLIFLEEENYVHFLEDFAELLHLGNGFVAAHRKNIKQLVDDRYIFTRDKEYRMYYGIQKDTKEVFISYVETYIPDTERNRELRSSLKNQFVLEDDQIRYKLFDAIMSAKKEILVAVPWITKKAWENKNDYPMSMEEAFEKTLQKEPNLKLLIATGINSGESVLKEQKDDTDEMVQLLVERFSKYKNRVLIYNNCEIHVKYLVVDDTCVMQGSLNYLSNQGIYKEEGGSLGHAGENMSISERPENVERGRIAVYRRAGQVYRRLGKD